MEKPIIATTLSGLFVKTDPWKNASSMWFEKAALQLHDNSVLEWIGKENYFDGVDEVMQRVYPGLTEEERTVKARELYFEVVCEYMVDHDVRNEEVIGYFDELKGKYRIALLTTNTQQAITTILPLVGLLDFFDIVEVSKVEEKDDKRVVFDRFIERYGKPMLYVGGDRKASYDYCAEKNIPTVFVNLESDEVIENVTTVSSVDELKNVIEKL